MSLNTADARTALAAALAGIDGLEVFPFVPDSISPPAAIITLDALTYDNTKGRGTDRAAFKIFVCVGKAYDQAASDAIDAYIAGDGDATESVKAAIDAVGANVANQSVVIQTVTLASQEFLAAVFDIDYVA